MLDDKSLWAIALKITGIVLFTIGIAGLLPQWFQLLFVSRSQLEQAFPNGIFVMAVVLPLLSQGVYILVGILLFLAPNRDWLPLFRQLNSVSSLAAKQNPDLLPAAEYAKEQGLSESDVIDQIKRGDIVGYISKDTWYVDYRRSTSYRKND